MPAGATVAVVDILRRTLTGRHSSGSGGPWLPLCSPRRRGIPCPGPTRQHLLISSSGMRRQSLGRVPDIRVSRRPACDKERAAFCLHPPVSFRRKNASAGCPPPDAQHANGRPACAYSRVPSATVGWADNTGGPGHLATHTTEPRTRLPQSQDTCRVASGKFPAAVMRVGGGGCALSLGQPPLAHPSPRIDPQQDAALLKRTGLQQWTESQTDTAAPHRGRAPSVLCQAPRSKGCGASAPRGHALPPSTSTRPRTSPQPHTGLQQLATGPSGGRGAGRRQAGRFAFAPPPPHFRFLPVPAQ